MAEEPEATLVVAVTTLCLGLSFVAVVLRFISRGIILRKINVDDWLIALAWVRSFHGEVPNRVRRLRAKSGIVQIFSFGIAFSIYLGTTYGLGSQYITEGHLVPERKVGNRNVSTIDIVFTNSKDSMNAS